MTRYKGYYITNRFTEHAGLKGLARVGIDYTYSHPGNEAVMNGESGGIEDKQETKVTFKRWITRKRFLRPIKK